MAATLGDIFVKVGADTRGYTAGISQVERTSKRTVGKLNSMGLALGAGMGAALVGIGAKATQMSIQFESAMGKVSTLIPGNVARIDELGDAMSNLAIDTGKSANDLAEGLFQVVSAFGDSSEAAEQAGIAARAATAGYSTTTEAVDLLSGVTKGYGDTSAEALQKVADLAFMTNKLGQTTFPELAASMGRVVPLAAKLNVSQEELFGGFATLTGVTGNTAEVSTQYAAILRALIKPTEDMKKAIADLGAESGGALIESMGLQNALNALIGTTDASEESIGKLFGRAESLTAVFALTGSQSDILREKTEAMTRAAGAQEEAYAQVADTTENKLARSQQAFSHAMRELGAAMAPAVEAVAQGFLDIVDTFRRASEAMRPVVIDTWRDISTLMENIGTDFADITDDMMISTQEAIAQQIAERRKLMLSFEKEGVVVESSRKRWEQARREMDALSHVFRIVTARGKLSAAQIKWLGNVADRSSEQVGKLEKELKAKVKRAQEAAEAARKAAEALEKDYTGAVDGAKTSTTGFVATVMLLNQTLKKIEIKKEILGGLTDIDKPVIGFKQLFDLEDLKVGMSGLGEEIEITMEEAGETSGRKFSDFFNSEIFRTGGTVETFANMFADMGDALDDAMGDWSRLWADHWEDVAAAGLSALGELTAQFGDELSMIFKGASAGSQFGLPGIIGGAVVGAFIAGQAPGETREQRDRKIAAIVQEWEDAMDALTQTFIENLTAAMDEGIGLTADLEMEFRQLTARGADTGDVIDALSASIAENEAEYEKLIEKLGEIPDAIDDVAISIDDIRRSMKSFRDDVRSASNTLQRAFLEAGGVFISPGADGRARQFGPGAESFAAVRVAIQAALKAGRGRRVTLREEREILEGIQDPQLRVLVQQLIEAENAKAQREQQLKLAREQRNDLRLSRVTIRNRLPEIAKELKQLQNIHAVLMEILNQISAAGGIGAGGRDGGIQLPEGGGEDPPRDVHAVVAAAVNAAMAAQPKNVIVQSLDSVDVEQYLERNNNAQKMLNVLSATKLTRMA